MKKNNQPTVPANDSEAPRRTLSLGFGGWFAIVVLALFLIAALSYAVYTWNALAGTPMPALGWLFMGLGAIFTLLIGGGLMALLFYSSRTGKDF